MIERVKEFPSLTIIRHPLVQHKLTILRDQQTETKTFKELVDEIAMLMAYEATSELSLEPREVKTPLEKTTGWHISGKKLTLVPILRAGLGMVRNSSARSVRPCRTHRTLQGPRHPPAGRLLLQGARRHR
jgi:uracil phosphoribosyltransferase